MKNIKVLSAFLMCLFALNFTACSSGGDDNDSGSGGGSGSGNSGSNFSDIYGGWRYEAGDECYLYHFFDDNSNALLIENPDSKNYYRSPMTYKVNNTADTLMLTLEDETQKVYAINLLDSAKLVLQSAGEDAMYVFMRYAGNADEDYPERIIPKVDAVDLGLSVKWAPYNVGATAPEEYGDYFAWGETETKDTYTFDNCETWYLELGNISGNIKYDAATACWRDGWRMPTCDELEELRNNCIWMWTTQNGVNGYNVTGSNGNSIFLPAGGWRYGSTQYYAEEYGCYWSSMPYDIGSRSAYSFDFTGSSCSFEWFGRGYGFNVRPVKQ